ncbi:hypothetical protein MA16_Dca028793 [Dendrobium catenatum]|uniref:Uncharacterized protein n=1 Tax=Dendrobium catenatum TaxID=906689 RepID=A0A2I0VAN4_9ASPA|nr:hypothetical protein MA16_Dca028793 [Dendrobium catenatum]
MCGVESTSSGMIEHKIKLNLAVLASPQLRLSTAIGTDGGDDPSRIKTPPPA